METFYNKRVWLNKVDSDSTGSIVLYDGKVSYNDTLVESRFIEIADCKTKIRLHQTSDDAKKEFINKLELLKAEIGLFISHLQATKSS